MVQAGAAWGRLVWAFRIVPGEGEKATTWPPTTVTLQPG